MRFTADPVVAAAVALAVLLSGCGSAKTIAPKEFVFEPRIVGCSGRPQECSSGTALQARELAEAHRHRCPEAEPIVLIRADGAFVCVSRSPAGRPTMIGASTPPVVRRRGASALSEFKAGEAVAARTGCLACHRIGEAGNRGPGRELTHVGSRLQPGAIERALVASPAPMPSFSRLPAAQRSALVYFLAQLK
jgi:hypothetical protein